MQPHEEIPSLIDHEEIGKISLKVDGRIVSGSLGLETTGNDTLYKTATLSGIDSKEGVHKVKGLFGKRWV